MITPCERCGAKGEHDCVTVLLNEGQVLAKRLVAAMGRENGLLWLARRSKALQQALIQWRDPMWR